MAIFNTSGGGPSLNLGNLTPTAPQGDTEDASQLLTKLARSVGGARPTSGAPKQPMFGSEPVPGGDIGAGQQNLLPGNMLGLGFPVVPLTQQAGQQQQQPQLSPGSFGTQSGQQQQQIKPLHEVKWKPTELNTGSGQAPDWWRPVVPADAKDAQRPDVGFLMMLNSMIPFLSPEDQRRAAAQLYAANADGFSFYKPEKIDIEVPVSERQGRFTERTGVPVIDEDFFLSSQRARDAISTLNQIREKTVEGNRWQLGPGYTWLQQVLGALEAFGGGGSTSIVTGEQHQQDEGPMTPAELLAQRGALDPLLSQAQSEAIGPIGSIGQMLSQPFFSQGQLVPFSRVAGQTQPGAPNPELF